MIVKNFRARLFCMPRNLLREIFHFFLALGQHLFDGRYFRNDYPNRCAQSNAEKQFFHISSCEQSYDYCVAQEKIYAFSNATQSRRQNSVVLQH